MPDGEEDKCSIHEAERVVYGCKMIATRHERHGKCLSKISLLRQTKTRELGYLWALAAHSVALLVLEPTCT